MHVHPISWPPLLARPRARRVLLPLLLPLALAACFDAGTPDAALFYCSDDDDCPAGLRCNTTTHLCGEDAPDTTAPTVLSLVLDDDDGVIADVPGSDALVLTGTASEPLARASVALGALEADCQVDGGSFSCALTIPAGFLQDGAQPVDVSVTDRAELSSATSTTVVLDTSPPRVEDGSVTVSITTAGVASDVAVATSDVTVTLLASEELAAGGASVALHWFGTRTPLSLVSQSGRLLVFRNDGDIPAFAGEHELVARLTDRFGHESGDLVIFTLPFSDAQGVCARPPGVSCVDIDGDGFYAPGDCVTGDDLDDTNVLVFPGAPEIPGDGLDNDGVAGDEAIDETTGVFVDCGSGDDENPGTRAAPLRTLAAAALATVGDQRAIFLATCATPYAGTVPDVVQRMIGGFDASTWSRSQARSVVSARFSAGSLLAGLELGDEVVTSGTSMVDTVAVRVAANAGLTRIMRSSVDTFVATSDSNVRIVDSVLGELEIFASTTLVRSRVRNATVISDASTGTLVAVSSLLEGRDRPAVLAYGALRIALFFSTVSVLNAGADPAITTTGLIPIDVIGSVVQSNGGVVLQSPAEGLRIVDSNLAGSGTLIRSGDDVITDLGGLDACETIGCLASSGNSSADQSDPDFHLAPSSPLRDRIVTWPQDAPASALVDYDGECRVHDVALDVGADEAH